MRNFDDSFMPQRFRMPEKDTRRFYEKPEWWIEFVKWGLIVSLLLGAAGFGISWASSKWKERQHRLEAAAQEARLRELEEAREREAKAAAAKAEKEAREKAKAEKERQRREMREEQERQRAEKEEARRALAAREKGPRRISDLDKALQTAGVRWWGAGTPPKFAARKEGDEYWCVFPDSRGGTFVRVKVGADKDSPAAIELVDPEGYMRTYERELLDEAVATRPHLVFMDRAAWVRIPAQRIEASAHVTVPERTYFYPAEQLLGEDLYKMVRSQFRSNDRLERLNCNLEFHWRDETHPPVKWLLKFDESIGSMKLSRAIETELQAELDAKNAAEDAKAAAKRPDRGKSAAASSGFSSGSSRGSLGGSARGSLGGGAGGSLGGGSGGRRMGEGRSGGLSGSSQQSRETAEQKAAEPPRKERVTRNDVQRVIVEGYLCASFAE